MSEAPGTACTARAMTLIEVLVASVLLGVGVAGLVFAGTVGLRNQQRCAQRIEALYWAQEKLAEISNMGPRVWSLAEPARGTEAWGGTTYEWSVGITPRTEGELFDVHVQVSWLGSRGSGSAELETWLNDYKAAAVMGSQTRDQKSPLELTAPPGG